MQTDGAVPTVQTPSLTKTAQTFPHQNQILFFCVTNGGGGRGSAAGNVKLLLGVTLSGGVARGGAFAAALLLGAASAGGWELSGVVEPAGG